MAGFEDALAELPLPSTPPGTTLAVEIAVGATGGSILAAVALAAIEGATRRAPSSAPAGPPPRPSRSEDVLAGVIALAVAAEAPLKLTAGLHHAVRFTDETTGFEHHGFLNVLLAFALALAGGAPEAVVDILAERDSAALVAAFRQLTPDQARAVRRRFVVLRVLRRRGPDRRPGGPRAGAVAQRGVPMSWLEVADDHPFGLATLPYGVFSVDGGMPSVGVRWVTRCSIWPLQRVSPAIRSPMSSRGSSLNPLMALGRPGWSDARQWVRSAADGETEDGPRAGRSRACTISTT